MKIGIAAIFKNEFPYILEWLAYHRLLGVDKFYIADNISNDGSTELLESLDELGYITRIPFHRVANRSPQKDAYNHILQEYGSEVDVLGYIDADEFIHVDGDFRQLVQRFHDSEFGAMALNWKIYGSNHAFFPTSDLVIERFTKHAPMDEDNNRHIKTLVKPNKASEMNIHECTLADSAYCHTGLELCEFDDSKAKTVQVRHEGAYVKHYVVKSRIEHFIMKMNKGSAAGSEKRKKGISYFVGHDINVLDEQVDSALVVELKAQIEHIQNDLIHNSSFMRAGHGVVNIDREERVIRGWVVGENKVPATIKFTYGDNEKVIPVRLNRPDVVRKGITNEVKCGFNSKLDINFDEYECKAYITGSIQELKVE
ncbi:glycosyltransferase family 92 protein [Vibrio astriarenae]|uniref:Glycosyltransferase family 92 protein n=1 Tax=Vibrio astriarenae TaxID=1481923 RepID=A0A7Z2T5B2_9VIBR|nr:glycosyltransferase family 2 protein [Vibrio astriarenae]QIA64447.1 glycosyltransferase family 92 protein [Vibrio astriarenae]